MTAFKWNWQLPNWPKFTYDVKALSELEYSFAKQSGEAFGSLKHIAKDDKDLLVVEILSDEALKTSEIEGEYLDRDSIQESIKRNFGLSQEKIQLPQAEYCISEMMFNLYQTFQNPLDHKNLFLWHEMLNNGRRDLIDICCYRTHQDSMQIISGCLDKHIVHYQAPPSDIMEKEMSRFVNWYNKIHFYKDMPTLTKAGITPLYFLAIHPFEDGNGRIARALSEKSISIDLGRPALLSLSQTINKHKKDYYSALEKHNTTLNITQWLVYFGETILDAQQNTIKIVEFLIKKAKFFDEYSHQINERQLKVIQRIFKEGYQGFKGGLSANNYKRVAKTSASTATRDLKDLVKKGIFKKTGQLKGTRYDLNLEH
jgi:Fic family protein